MMQLDQPGKHEGPARALLERIRAKGSNATTLRDAVHEACHALAWGVRKRWTRDNIHARAPKARSFGVADEITARAVEQLVCRELGVDPGPVAQWAFVCWMETLKNENISLPTGDWLETAIVARMQTEAAKRMVWRILDLNR